MSCRCRLLLGVLTVLGCPVAVADDQVPTIEGLELSAISTELRQTFLITDSVDGVVIVGVGEGSFYATKEIRRGDVIVEVPPNTVSTPSDVIATVEDLIAHGRQGVMLHMARPGGSLRFVLIPIEQLTIRRPAVAARDIELPALPYGLPTGPPEVEPRQLGLLALIEETIFSYRDLASRYLAAHPAIRENVLHVVTIAVLISVILVPLLLLAIAARNARRKVSGATAWLKAMSTAGTSYLSEFWLRMKLAPAPTPHTAAAIEAMRLAHAYIAEVSEDRELPSAERTRDFVNTLSIAAKHIALAEIADPSAHLDVEDIDGIRLVLSNAELKVRALYYEGLARSPTQPRRAIRALRRAVAIDPSDAPSRALMGVLYTRLFNRWRACRSLRQAVILDPTNMTYRKHLGRAEVITLPQIIFDRIVKTVRVAIKLAVWTAIGSVLVLYGAFGYFLLVAALSPGGPSIDTMVTLAAIWGVLVLIGLLIMSFERLKQWIKNSMVF